MIKLLFVTSSILFCTYASCAEYKEEEFDITVNPRYHINISENTSDDYIKNTVIEKVAMICDVLENIFTRRCVLDNNHVPIKRMQVGQYIQAFSGISMILGTETTEKIKAVSGDFDFFNAMVKMKQKKVVESGSDSSDNMEKSKANLLILCKKIAGYMKRDCEIEDFQYVLSKENGKNIIIYNLNGLISTKNGEFFHDLRMKSNP